MQAILGIAVFLLLLCLLTALITAFRAMGYNADRIEEEKKKRASDSWGYLVGAYFVSAIIGVGILLLTKEYGSLMIIGIMQCGVALLTGFIGVIRAANSRTDEATQSMFGIASGSLVMGLLLAFLSPPT